MKKKVMLWLLAAIFILSLYFPAQAAHYYGNMYDATELVQEGVVKVYGEEYLPQAGQPYGLDLRVDILSQLAAATLEESAAYLYDEYDYGMGEDKKGISLTLLVHEDEGGMYLEDFCVYAGGTSEEFRQSADRLQVLMQDYFKPGIWFGDLDMDINELTWGLDHFMEESIHVLNAVEFSGVPASLPMEAEEAVKADLDSGKLCLAHLLTPEEERILDEYCRDISETYGCGVYFLTVEDFKDYGELDIIETAKAMFENYSLGMGEDKSGILLLLSMDERDYAVAAHGSANTAFTDFGKIRLHEKFLKYFKEDDWAGGFTAYAEKSEDMLRLAREGRPLDVDTDPAGRLYGIIICIGISVGLAFLVRSILRSRLNSVAEGRNADSYITEAGLDLTRKLDTYTHSTESRVYDPPESKDNGGGGTSVDSDGYSSDSGKF